METETLTDLTLVQGDHLKVLEKAFKNILFSDLAIEAFAQIIDGLPLGKVAYTSGTIYADHPNMSHDVLCPRILERAKSFISEFNIMSLRFELNLVDAYRGCAIDSRACHMRLIELVAVAIHQVGVQLFKQNICLHDPESTDGMSIAEVTTWEKPFGPYHVRIEPFPTLFTNINFTAKSLYPEGLADMVGYWTENWVLGGVALFDRTQTWKDSPEPTVYWQTSRFNATHNVWQLLEEQQQELIAFLLADVGNPSLMDPLPILPSRINKHRVDPDLAMPKFKIYRNTWERLKASLTDWPNFPFKRRCVGEYV